MEYKRREKHLAQTVRNAKARADIIRTILHFFFPAIKFACCSAHEAMLSALSLAS